MFAKYEDFYAFEGDFYANFYTSIIYLDRRVNFTITMHSFSRFPHRKSTIDDEIMSSPILEILMMGL